uniref:(northern house mosquito) hypothetical protein n=1 Tax=Culex pipiens TaxID=7175 RepID=A0A8D8CVE6_CULPI
MERTQKKNTIGFEFERDGVMPTLKEAISFLVNDLKIKDTEVHSVYLDLTGKTFFVKFIDETTLKEVTLRLKETEPFKYANGKVVQVRVAAADGFFRYVRLFNLPPEVTDSDITKVMAKYGTVRQMIREKLPLELGFDAFSGTRGVHMEVKTEIPPSLFIGHYKCRIFYDGLRNRCFVCRQEGHVKAACPSKASASRATGESGSSSEVQGVTEHVENLIVPLNVAVEDPIVPNGTVPSIEDSNFLKEIAFGEDFEDELGKEYGENESEKEWTTAKKRGRQQKDKQEESGSDSSEPGKSKVSRTPSLLKLQSEYNRKLRSGMPK